jgi:hypothetical protein
MPGDHLTRPARADKKKMIPGGERTQTNVTKD